MTSTAIATHSYLPDYLTKKMERQLLKLFGKEMTYQEVSTSDSIAINHQLFRLTNTDTITGYSIITRALGCKIGGCDKPSTDSLSFEQFYFFTAFDAQKNIKKVRVLEYTSDHGYQIANKGWLRQFEGGSLFFLNENIDGLSGATISVKSIIDGVNKQNDIVRSLD
ncbi:FMN-binding protein [Bacteroidia bacterium]|nr:FMN-binding protein [Bacteroidia bacterium]MDC1395261.1 FMN-binding protein [Bacteroidia bacterium]MDC1395275.1 FMN-binding protein [Bacteroidia bacterium]